MLYTRKQFDHDDGYGDAVCRSNLSCGFYESTVDGRRYVDAWSPRDNETPAKHETRLWNALCEILTVSEQRPVLISTTDKEPEWRDLLAMCPHITQLSEVQSRMGNYKVQLWIANTHERPEE